MASVFRVSTNAHPTKCWIAIQGVMLVSLALHGRHEWRPYAISLGFRRVRIHAHLKIYAIDC